MPRLQDFGDAFFEREIARHTGKKNESLAKKLAKAQKELADMSHAYGHSRGYRLMPVETILSMLSLEQVPRSLDLYMMGYAGEVLNKPYEQETNFYKREERWQQRVLEYFRQETVLSKETGWAMLRTFADRFKTIKSNAKLGLLLPLLTKALQEKNIQLLQKGFTNLLPLIRWPEPALAYFEEWPNINKLPSRQLRAVIDSLGVLPDDKGIKTSSKFQPKVKYIRQLSELVAQPPAYRKKILEGLNPKNGLCGHQMLYLVMSRLPEYDAEEVRYNLAKLRGDMTFVSALSPNENVQKCLYSFITCEAIEQPMRQSVVATLRKIVNQKKVVNIEDLTRLLTIAGEQDSTLLETVHKDVKYIVSEEHNGDAYIKNAFSIFQSDEPVERKQAKLAILADQVIERGNAQHALQLIAKFDKVPEYATTPVIGLIQKVTNKGRFSLFRKWEQSFTLDDAIATGIIRDGEYAEKICSLASSDMYKRFLHAIVSGLEQYQPPKNQWDAFVLMIRDVIQSSLLSAKKAPGNARVSKDTKEALKNFFQGLACQPDAYESLQVLQKALYSSLSASKSSLHEYRNTIQLDTGSLYFDIINAHKKGWEVADTEILSAFAGKMTSRSSNRAIQHGLDALVRATDEIDPETRRAVLHMCGEYIQKIPDYSNKIQQQFVQSTEALCDVLPTKYSLMKQEIITWLKSVLDLQDPHKIIQYMNDEGAYHQHEQRNLIQGTQLQTVEGRLLAYVHALTGENFLLVQEETSALTVRLDKHALRMPKAVNVGSFEENYAVYKTMASLQVGALQFGTYDMPESFGDERSEYIFGFFEMARLEARLIEQYPGLANAFSVYHRACVDSSTAEDGNYAIMHVLNNMAHDGKIKTRRTKKMQKIVREIADCFEFVREKQSVQASIEATKRVASLFTDEPLKTPEQPPQVRFVDNTEENEAVTIIRESGASQLDLVGSQTYYPEWDGQTFKPDFVRVVQVAQEEMNSGYAETVIEKNAVAIRRIRERFEALRPSEDEVKTRMASGEPDYESVVRARAEQKAGITPDDRVYQKHFRNVRSVATLLLSEVSSSTRTIASIPKEMRVLDCLKHAMLWFGYALEELQDEFSIGVYSGSTEKQVQYATLKEFSEPFDNTVRARIGGLQPMEQNRDGAGIRHATQILTNQPAKYHILAMMTDGHPYDIGYEEAYALDDTLHALVEAKELGVLPLLVVFGKDCKRMRLFADHMPYMEVTDATMLPEAIPSLYADYTF